MRERDADEGGVGRRLSFPERCGGTTPVWYGGGEKIDDPEAEDAREEVEPALCIVCNL